MDRNPYRRDFRWQADNPSRPDCLNSRQPSPSTVVPSIVGHHADLFRECLPHRKALRLRGGVVRDELAAPYVQRATDRRSVATDSRAVDAGTGVGTRRGARPKVDSAHMGFGSRDAG
jgi:hypothetical protein